MPNQKSFPGFILHLNSLEEAFLSALLKKNLLFLHQLCTKPADSAGVVINKQKELWGKKELMTKANYLKVLIIPSLLYCK